VEKISPEMFHGNLTKRNRVDMRTVEGCKSVVRYFVVSVLCVLDGEGVNSFSNTNVHIYIFIAFLEFIQKYTKIPDV